MLKDENKARPAAKGSEASTSSIDKICYTITLSKFNFLQLSTTISLTQNRFT
jgi:hypothetical protein